MWEWEGGNRLGNSYFVGNVRWEVEGEQQGGVISLFPRGRVMALLSP